MEFLSQLFKKYDASGEENDGAPFYKGKVRGIEKDLGNW